MLRILPMPVAQYRIDGKDLFTSIQMQDYAIDCQEAAKEENKFSPPKREWVGLTRAERFEIERAMSKYYDYQHECKTVCLPEFAAAIEAKLKEKNT